MPPPIVRAGKPFWLKVYIADTETTYLWDVPQKTKVQMIRPSSSLLSMLLLFMAEAQKSGCDLKHAERLDEQVFVQLRSEVSDSKDSDTGVAARPRWRWRRRRNRPYSGYRPYGPTTTITSTTTSSTTNPIPVCPALGIFIGVGNFTPIAIPADVNTTALLTLDAPSGCCVSNESISVDLNIVFDGGDDVTREGNLTVFLETPDLQSKELGVAAAWDIFFGFAAISFRELCQEVFGRSLFLLRQMLQGGAPLSTQSRSANSSVYDLGMPREMVKRWMPQ